MSIIGLLADASAGRHFLLLESVGPCVRHVFYPIYYVWVCKVCKTPSQMDVTPWCAKYMGWARIGSAGGVRYRAPWWKLKFRSLKRVLFLQSSSRSLHESWQLIGLSKHSTICSILPPKGSTLWTNLSSSSSLSFDLGYTNWGEVWIKIITSRAESQAIWWLALHGDQW